jgi:Flp pilus assembly pilin Flp
LFRSLDLAARFRAFARDEAGITTFESFLIAAFAGAACVVVLEAMGFSLAGALGIGTRARN